MARTSAGLLLHRRRDGHLEVLLVHPGGPFWAKKDLGAWSIPKGEHGPDDDELACAEREFAEELGSRPPPARPGHDLDLGTIRQSGGKVVRAFAREGDLDADAIVSNEFEVEWPPRSGRRQVFPEVDRAGWFTLDEARDRINAAQAAFLERLAHGLGVVG
ncbi:MAG TPA: NUDIX domain-containing protein [Aquihabitans sp.]|nr:NUDIX domain-containing protein [Aquihabitans sp.]